MANTDNANQTAANDFAPPAISLPKGGGAIRGIGEKFAANPVTGTGSMTVPIATSPGRSGFGPQLALSYDSGAGNGPFGLGWNLSLPSITRKTDKGLPRYQDDQESDTFILSGSEDLVPVLVEECGEWRRKPFQRSVDGVDYQVQRYRPRIEGLFARIERWVNLQTRETHWRSITRDNITTLYGKTAESRITDPADSTRVFSWLICESYDDKGNAIRYEYVAEDSAGVALKAHERNRTDQSRSADRYLKRIKYGNLPSRLVEPDLSKMHWLFEVVFDYGEGHYELLPEDQQGRQFVRAVKDQTSQWPARQDPFSSYRAAFEVRTYRLCQRVLMFHHFPEELGTDDYLVRSTEFNYKQSPLLSFITAVTQSGYVRRTDGTYLKKSLPPLEYEYSQAIIDERIQEIDAASLENLPYGLDGANYRWVDLDGEGLSGILTEQGNTWFYKENLGGGRFGAMQVVASKPSLAGLSSGPQQLLDLAGDGQLDLVQLSRTMPGFYERTQDQLWEPFTPFPSWPNISFDDPNVRFIDLTGDGHADVLITEHEALTWYPSLAEDGFGQAEKVRQAFEEERGPRVIFTDSTQSIFLADMSGDGLPDIVRIRNGEICYWPSLGYGRFGAKVTMDDAPVFDMTDLFDQRRVQLVDIDGSGVSDIVYLARDGIQLYFNQAGNAWSQARSLPQFPRTDTFSLVTVVDLLGNGTACVVWSSPLPGYAQRPMRYIDLMGGQKPHLIIATRNNMGAETNLQYAPSTKFYLADKLEGKPWITKLPFPVHVVERVETLDRISRNRFVTRYAYHHGYFDGVEREFRGFGMVEQIDTEEFASLSASGTLSDATNIDQASHVPPVLIKTWFHTGAYLSRDHVSDFFAGLLNDLDVGEYYREPGLSDAEAKMLLLEDSVLPEGLSFEEEREACRALKGSVLRQEKYALDGTDKQQNPYIAVEQNFVIKVLQPRGGNRHAVFFTHAREDLNYHYDRNPTDPRVVHVLTLQVDEYGNVLRSVAVGYPRANVPQRQPEQNETHLTLKLNRSANRDDDPDWRRIGLPVEMRTYEVVKPPISSLRFAWEDLRDLVEALVPFGQIEALPTKEIPYEQWDWRKQWNPQTELGGYANTRLRPVEHVCTFYRPDDLGSTQGDPQALLPLGTVQSLALPGESYKLAFTPELLAKNYQRPLDVVPTLGSPPTPENLLPNPANVLGGQGTEHGGYIDLNDCGEWWIPSGRMFFSPLSKDGPTDELLHARNHFFRPLRHRDPFHTNAISTESFIRYDAYDLLMVETHDALNNRITAGERDAAGNVTNLGNDYRVLQPKLITDSNRNRTAAAFDALGMVTGSAVMGKSDENLGDSLEGFETDLTPEVIREHLDTPLASPEALLQRATTRQIYDFSTYQRTSSQANPLPAVVYTIARETHDSDPVPAGGLKVQHSFSYADGFGREIQVKVRAEAGPVPKRDSAGRIIVGDNGEPEMTPHDITERWAGSSWIIFNNKSKPVRQYEPFFTDTHRFEADVRAGVSSVVFYDPVERVVGTLHPNHTWEKVQFHPWRQEAWDVGDTILVADPKTDPDLGDFFRRLPDSDYLPTWYALRQDGVLGPQEQSAARKAAIYANTPLIAHADTLERTFLTIALNAFKYTDAGPDDPGTRQSLSARVIFDIEGNQREVIDAKHRVVVRYDYDMLGHRIHQSSMEAGERWLLNDVAGNPLYAWDSRNYQFRTAYDPLRRATEAYVREGVGPELLVGRSIYGESQLNSETKNLRGKTVNLFDQAGVITSEEFDFKGNLLRSHRQLAESYKTTLDWSNEVPLETPSYTSNTTYDALNRPVQLVPPHSDQPEAKINVIQQAYNEGNLLNQVHAWFNLNAEPASVLAADTANLHPVTDVEYDANGRRTRIEYGNGVRTTYSYDPLTKRLLNLLTRRENVEFPDDCPQPSQAGWPGCEVQNLHYTYDPVGNITYIRDDAQQTIYFRNKRVEPSADYTYDALYRLIEATGREHLGQVGAAPKPYSYKDKPRVGVLFSASDGNAMGRYLQRYVYDLVGNLERLTHRGADPVNPGWTRDYIYNEPSQLQPGVPSNRLTSTTSGATTETYSSGGNGYDAHGNMLSMPHLQILQWGFKDQLQMTQRQAVNADDEDGQRHGERTWYVYDSGGQRVRKVTEHEGVPGGTPTRRAERIYLGGFEIYHKYENDSGTLTLERETLHIMDDKRRVALIETRTKGSDPGPEHLIRFQFNNHVGSSTLELDDAAAVISYEEYYPYGSTSYQAVRNRTETPKRYRYTGKERDSENGFYYHGARYYAPWIARWVSADPTGTVDGTNLYSYARNNPLTYADPTGKECDPTTATCIDPTIPTPREEAEQRSLPEDERYEPAESQAEYPAGARPEDELTPTPMEELKQQSLPEDERHLPDDEEPSAEAEPPAPAEAAPTEPEEEGGVGAPGFGESLIPVWGSGRESINHFQQGNPVRGIFWGAMAISDVFLVKALVVGVGKAGAKALFSGAVHAAPEVAAHAAPEVVAHTAPEIVAHAVPEVVTHSAPEVIAHTAPEVVAHSAPQVATHSAATVVAHVAPTLPAALAGGAANTSVYLGIRGGSPVYVGITVNMARRQSQHGARFVLQEITTSPLTRGEARAVEQALIARNPLYENLINSISPRHAYYQQAVDWGEAWLRARGL